MTVLLLAIGMDTSPHGLADIYYFLQQRGESVEFLHLYDKPSRLDGIHSTPEFVGITSHTTNSPKALALAGRVRHRWPHAKIVLGGRHICDDTLKHQGDELTRIADHLVIGDGEYAMLEILGGNADQVVRSPFLSAADYAMLPLPEMDFVAANFRAEPHGVTLTRGCPFRCLFCGDPRTRLIRKEPDVAVAYLRRLTDHLRREVFVYDDVFTASKPWLRLFVEEYKRQRATFKMRCFIHANCLDAEILELLGQCGTYKASLGAESGDDETLRRINKHTTCDQYAAIQKMFTGSPITLRTLWMLGNIGETNETMAKTVGLSRRIGTDDQPWFSYAIPFPGTKFWAVAEQYGKIMDWDFDHWDNRHVIFTPHGVAVKDVQRWRQKGMAGR